MNYILTSAEHVEEPQDDVQPQQIIDVEWVFRDDETGMYSSP